MSRVLAFAAVFSFGSALAEPAELMRSTELYQTTDYDASLRILLATDHKDPRALALIGQNYFMKGEYKKATDYFQKAVDADPKNADYCHWLGRAYGRRAETSGVFTAAGYASKSRQFLEKAVQLNPNDKEALNDLFEYYLQAPGFLGGGLEKAVELTKRIGELDPAEYHFAMARVAEKRKEFNTAEQQLRRAAELAPREVGRVIDLARFLAKQGRYQESDAAFHKATTIAPDDPQVLFERAAAYVESRRNLDVAQDLLRKFLESPLRPNHPSRSEANKLLKQAAGGG